MQSTIFQLENNLFLTKQNKKQKKQEMLIHLRNGDRPNYSVSNYNSLADFVTQMYSSNRKPVSICNSHMIDYVSVELRNHNFSKDRMSKIKSITSLLVVGEEGDHVGGQLGGVLDVGRQLQQARRHLNNIV